MRSLDRLMVAGCVVVALVAPPSLAQTDSDLPFFPKPPAPGPCPSLPFVRDFDLHRYLGRWYEIERFFAPFQSGDCVTADYELFPNGSVSVINTQDLGGELDSAFGIADLGVDPTEGRLLVKFPFSGTGPDPVEPNYLVVATDYDNYAVVYSCTANPQFKIEFSWILARRPEVPATFITALKEWLTLVGVDVSRYSPLRQDSTCLRRPLHKY